MTLQCSNQRSARRTGNSNLTMTKETIANDPPKKHPSIGHDQRCHSTNLATCSPLQNENDPSGVAADMQSKNMCMSLLPHAHVHVSKHLAT
jgi:hypothetical protein